MKINSRPIVLAIFGIVLAFLIATAVTFCGLHEMKTDDHAAGTSTASYVTDYSDKNNWAYFAEGDGKTADLFLIAPTVDMNDEFNMSLDDKETMGNFLGALNMERGIYEDSTRMFAPYYRQGAMKIYSLNESEREPYLGLAYEDVSAAFKWYLENENNGRPIVLAGFSQGADMCYRLLKEYFTDRSLRDKLIAVYAIGWQITETEISAYPQMIAATGETDTGVIVTFDCESPDVTDTFINPAGRCGACINPLTWTTDSEPASKNLNPGACFTDYSGDIVSEVPELCGCYIDLTRGVLKVTDISKEDYPAYVPGLPDGGYHVYDYQFFFRALQINVDKRVNAYMTTIQQAA